MKQIVALRNHEPVEFKGLWLVNSVAASCRSCISGSLPINALVLCLKEASADSTLGWGNAYSSSQPPEKYLHKFKMCSYYILSVFKGVT
jgi:hypothetical protein